MRTCLLGLLAAASVFAQAPKFEVASIRPAPPSRPEQMSVGLHLDGAQVRITSFSIRDYVALAYRLKAYQVNGPEWITSARFEINAKLPENAKAEQIPEMLQTLLAERFQLKLHRDKKELPVYALILGKTPLKLKPSAPDSRTGEAQSAVNVSVGASAQGVSVSLGHGAYYTFSNNKFEAVNLNIELLPQLLETYLDRPIISMIDLTGVYDIVLNVTQEDYGAMMIRAAVNSGIALAPEVVRFADGNQAGSLLDAIQQLGLKLDPRKAPLDVLVIDSVSKAPTEN